MDWPSDGMLGPAMGAVAQLEQSSIAPGPWLALGAIVLAGGVAALVRRARAAAARRNDRSG
jgi:hypothetical protein